MSVRNHRRAPRWVSSAALVGLGLALAGCLPDFAPASQLGDEPQVLVIRASAPEAAPGTAVTLDALVHWPEGMPDYLWLVCVPAPGESIDVCVKNHIDAGEWPLAACGGATSAGLCYASRDATAVYTVPDFGLEPDETLTLYVEVLVGVDAEGAACWRALSELDPSSDCIVGLKRLEVSSAAAPNTNPRLLGLDVNGQTVDAWADVVVDARGEDLDTWGLSLSVSVDATSVDELARGEEPPAAVHLPVAWYSTCGEFDDDEGRIRCEASDPPTCEPVETVWAPQTSGECTLYAVLRDPDGGADYLTQRFLIATE